MINKIQKNFVAGHKKGLIGSAILRRLESLNYKKVLLNQKKIWI